MWKKISWTIACAAIVAIALVANDQGHLAGRDDPSWLDRSLSEFGVVDALIPQVEAAPPESPVAEAGPGQTVTVDDTVVLDASGSYDPKGSVVDFSWQLISVPSGSLAVLSDTTAVKPTFVPDLAGDYVAELVVSQGNRTSDPDTVTLSTNNTAPVADAGNDRAVFVSDIIELDGSRSTDVNGDALTYAWTVVSVPAGSGATLSDPTTVRPDFTVDVAGDYEFDLVVDDGTAPSAADRVLVSTNSNIPPRADTGPNRGASVGQTVPMDPSFSSDANSDEISLEWNVIARPSASSANITKPKDDSPRFDIDVAGLYVVQVELTDDPGAVSFETMIVSTGNIPPYTDAGADQSVLVSEVVTLDGTGSTDVNGDALTFEWALLSKPAGSAAILSDAAAARPTFTVDVAGLYVAQLIVGDDTEAGRPHTVAIGTTNSTPFAGSGPDQTVTSGDLVQLDGTGSDDADLDALTYDWALTLVPKGSSAAISDPAAVSPTFTATKKGVYVAQLTVDDGTTEGAADGLVIRTTNSRPLAAAGADQTANLGELVQLDGVASSDADNDPLTYSWALIVQPAGSTATLSSATAVNPTFTGDVSGLYVAQLIVSDALFDSEADTAVMDASNSAPVADAGPDQAVTAGATVQLDGSGSSDPENDPLAYSWSLNSVPAGSAASLSDPNIVNPSFQTDAPGSYVAQLVVSDGELPSPADQVTITANPVTAGNVAPVLNSVGNQSVDLGDILALTLTATDVNGDALAFSASPLPLPAGASLDGMTGDFSFTPDASQVGTIDLTFMVSDGLLFDSEAVVITVNGPPPGGMTAITGRLLDSIDANQGTTTPIVGATISVAGDPTTTTSDTNGDFTLSGIPSGSQVFEVDSTTAGAAPDGSDYASFHEELVLIDSVNNLLAQAVYLPRIDPAGIAVVDPQTTTMVENTNIDVMLVVPPNTAKDELGNDFSGELSISEVPVDFAPMALPEDLQPSLLISIQPTGVTFATPVPITFPNTDGLTPGSEVDIYSLDPEAGQFVIVGTGTVSPDGSEITTTTGGIMDASWHMILPPALLPGLAGPLEDILDPKKCVPCNAGSVSHISSGNLSENHELASYRSLNRSRSLNFIYNSTSADPQPVVRADATILFRSPLPGSVSAQLQVGGVDQGAPIYTATTGLSESQDETITQVVQFDASGLATGSYPYNLKLTNHFGNATVSSRSVSRILVNNEIASPFGAGWTLDGLERLYPQADGSAVITRGDGSILRFPLIEPLQEFDDFADLSAFTLNGTAVTINATPVEFGGQTVLRLTNGRSQGATALLTEPVLLEFEGQALSFSSFFSFQITDSLGTADAEGPGADGITFFIADAPTHLSSSGGYFALRNVSPSLAVEFDTWRNGWDQNTNHVGVDLNGSVTSVAQIFHLPAFNNDIVKYAWVDYDAATTTLEVRVEETPVRPASPTLTHVVDIRALMGAPQAHFGFTSGTGVAHGDHDIRSWRLELLAPNLETVFLTPPGNFSTLDQNPDDSFTRTLTNGTVIEYDAAGLQTSMTDRNGNATTYGYDGQDRLTTITDPVGKVTTLAYGGDGLLDTVSDPASRVTSFQHDGAGDLTRIVDPDLSERDFAYDARHRLTSQDSKRDFATTYDFGFHGRLLQANLPDTSTRKVDPGEVVGLIDPASGLGTQGNPAPFVRPDAVVATFTDGNDNVTSNLLDGFGKGLSSTDALNRTRTAERDANSQITRATAPNGRVNESTYDANGNRLTRTEAVGDPLERVTTSVYEPVFNQVTQVTDPAGKVTTFEYDTNGNRTKITDPLLGERTFTYNAQGRVLTATDENLNTSTFVYDADGNLENVTDAETNETQFTRDTAGRITAITEGFGSPEARTSTFTYDALNRVLTATDGENGTTTLTYDAAGNVTDQEDATNIVQLRSYDSRERLTQIDDPASGITSFTYDATGNLKTVTDALSAVTTFEYDAANRRTKTIDALTNEELFVYDDNNNLTSLTDARGNPTSFAYDLLDRVTTDTNPLSQIATFAYDSRDNLTSVTDPKSQTVTYGYDDLSRLTTITTPDNTIAFGFDPASNITSVTDSDSDLSFTYDGLNRQATADTNVGGAQPLVTLTNTYDALSNRSQLLDSAGGTTLYAYDAADRLTQLTTPANDIVDLAYDPAGRLTQILFPNGIASDYVYDPEGRLSDLTHSLVAVPQLDFDYGYNAVGNIDSIVQPSETRSFGYDDLQRLISGGTAGAPESYAYDPEGNRTSSHLSASHTTDIANRLSEDDAFCYAYDLNGNLTTKTAKVVGACTGDVTTYTYDAQGQLIQIDFPDLTVATYLYDGLGRRIEKDVDGTITRTIHDGSDIVLEYDGANVLQARYSHGDQVDQPLAQERAGQSYFYQTDHQGSVRQLTDSVGAVANSYTYDSYGRIEASSETVSNPYLYTGREFDSESGLYFYRARYYDPATGRFVSEDPIGFAAGDANLYRYVFNNPANLTDPSGTVVPAAIAACAANPACAGPILAGAGALYCIVTPGLCEIDALNDIGNNMANENIEDDNADPKESESKNPDSPSGPQCIGNNPRPKGKGDSTDLPGGLGAAQDLFDQLTGGQSTLDPETGTLIGDNKTQLRPQGSAEDPRPRVDVPANVGTSGKHETIHFND